MVEQPAIYGLDLVTDTDGPLIDPATDHIVAVGLSSATADERFEGDEASLLQELDERLTLARPGVLATWDGSIVALPLLAARARHCAVALSLQLQVDRRSAPPSPVRGLAHAVRARWGEHQVLDLRRVYEPSRRWSLRQRDWVEELIPPTDQLAERDPCRDARLARCLAERRWSQARRHIDALSKSEGSAWMPTRS